jgi:hypothetical protein
MFSFGKNQHQTAAAVFEHGNGRKHRGASHGQVLNANWNPDNRQVKVNSNTSDDADPYRGARSSDISIACERI